MNSGLKKNRSGLKRKPFLTPIWLAAVAALIVLSFATWLWGTADSTTVIVVRHAEKDLQVPADPPLTAAGKARAEALAKLFADDLSLGRLTAIYITATTRSRATAAPLSARLGLTPREAPDDDPRALARRVLREHPGGRVLIIGHADTIPELVSVLSGQKVPALGNLEYDTIYIVTVPRIGRANLLRLSY